MGSLVLGHIVQFDPLKIRIGFAGLASSETINLWCTVCPRSSDPHFI